jgi:3-oxoadipate enol-lactonase
MPTIDVPGARLQFRLDGAADAPVAVLSNSLGTTLAMWDGQMAALTRRFRVLRYDVRGHGGSSLSSVPLDIEHLGRDVVALLDALGLERVHFCGLSLGGMVGLWLGAHAPHRLHKLVLSNTAAAMAPRSAWDERIDAVTKGGTAVVAPGVIGRWFTPGFRDREPAAVERVRQMLLTTSPAGYIAACAAVRDMDQRSSVARVRVPTLVIAGRDDVATPPAASRWLALQIPGARLVELPAAHLSNVEAEGLFNERVFEFLSAEESPDG